MKKMMLLGGLLGFLIGLGFGFAGQADWPGVLWKACVAAYLAGLLMRWWAKIWVKCLRDAFTEQLNKEVPDSSLPNEMKEKQA